MDKSPPPALSQFNFAKNMIPSVQTSFGTTKSAF